MAMYISDKRIVRNAEGQIVDESDPSAAFLVVAEGGTISDQEAAKYGLAKTTVKPDTSPNSDKPGEDNADEANQAGLSERAASALAAAGFDTPEKVAAASDDELRAVPGIGTATLAKIRG